MALRHVSATWFSAVICVASLGAAGSDARLAADVNVERFGDSTGKLDLLSGL